MDAVLKSSHRVIPALGNEQPLGDDSEHFSTVKKTFNADIFIEFYKAEAGCCRSSVI